MSRIAGVQPATVAQWRADAGVAPASAGSSRLTTGLRIENDASTSTDFGEQFVFQTQPEAGGDTRITSLPFADRKRRLQDKRNPLSEEELWALARDPRSRQIKKRRREIVHTVDRMAYRTGRYETVEEGEDLRWRIPHHPAVTPALSSYLAKSGFQDIVREVAKSSRTSRSVADQLSTHPNPSTRRDIARFGDIGAEAEEALSMDEVVYVVRELAGRTLREATQVRLARHHDEATRGLICKYADSHEALTILAEDDSSAIQRKARRRLKKLKRTNPLVA